MPRPKIWQPEPKPTDYRWDCETHNEHYSGITKENAILWSNAHNHDEYHAPGQSSASWKKDV